MAKLLFMLIWILSMTTSTMAAEPLKIVTFGTSLTARGGWQEPLAAALRQCLKRPVDVQVVAKSGETSAWAVSQIGAVVSARPDIVLIEFYANDAAVNRFMTVGTSRANMEIVLSSLKRDLPDSRLVMTVMNPFSGMRGMIRPFASSYIAAHLELAERFGLEIVDYTADWNRLDPEALARAIPDGTHPQPEAAASIIVPRLARHLFSQCADSVVSPSR